MSRSRPKRTLSIGGLCMLLAAPAALAHGFAGKRFFPTTLAVDDPFVSDELSFLFGHGVDSSRTSIDSISADFSKRLTHNFGLSFGGTFQRNDPLGASSESGFNNLELGAKYLLFVSRAHETLGSIGLNAEVGGTGAAAIGAESVSTVSPTIYFGKGFGDLPDAARLFRPLAVTAILGVNFPTEAETAVSSTDPMTGLPTTDTERNPETVSWGFTVQYNLQYLQSFVKDVGLRSPFDRMIPIVEFAFDTCLNRGCSGQTTGTVNPGLIWVGKSVQLGLEAQVPVNDRTGQGLGVLALLHFFIDDLYPHSLGRPLFGHGGSL